MIAGLCAVEARAQSDTLANPPLVDSAMQQGWRDFTPYKTPGMCLRAVSALGVVTARRADESHRVPSSDIMVRMAVTCGARFSARTVNPEDLLDLMHLSLGAIAALQRRLVHKILLDHAQQIFDIPQIGHEALAIISAYPQLRAADRTDRDENGPFAGVMAILQAELLRNPATAILQTTTLIKPFLTPENLQVYQAGIRQQKINWVVAQVGRPVPALSVPYWLSASGGAQEWPVPGKVSIYAWGGDVQDNPGRWDSAQVERWQRLAQKHGNALNITFICQTAGYFGNSGPLQPREEAERLRHYFFDQLKLPVMIALDTTVFTQLPDGRRVATPRKERAHEYYRQGFILADSKGRVVLLGSSAPSERALDSIVTRTIAMDGKHD